MKSLFEEMGGTYTLGADGMYYPDLELPEEEPHYGKYGRMRLRYLKEHHKMLYNTLLLDGELVKHLNEVDDTANQRMELLTLQMQEQQGINFICILFFERLQRFIFCSTICKIIVFVLQNISCF